MQYHSLLFTLLGVNVGLCLQESDEKAALGKVAASRADSMKKSIEETIFAPRFPA